MKKNAHIIKFDLYDLGYFIVGILIFLSIQAISSFFDTEYIFRVYGKMLWYISFVLLFAGSVFVFQPKKIGYKFLGLILVSVSYGMYEILPANTDFYTNLANSIIRLILLVGIGVLGFITIKRPEPYTEKLSLFYKNFALLIVLLLFWAVFIH
jgi:hypothetical protein